MKQLQAKINEFGGAIIEQDSLPEGTDEFMALLEENLQTWKHAHYKLVWLKIPREKASLIPCAVAAAFTFHHCQVNYVMLTHQLQDAAFIFPYASHYIGAGAVILSKQQESPPKARLERF